MNARSESSQNQLAATQRDPGTIRVWDPVVRLFHWTVVAGCAINLIVEDGNEFHRAVGYVVAAAVAVRVVWGFVGAGHARFSDFVPRPAVLVGYMRQLVSRSEPRFIGHNPAGAVMILALLGSLIGVSITGWMMGLDRFFGNETLEELHETFAMTILVLAGFHVAAAIFESVRHRENLIKSMFTGRKRKPTGADVDHAIDSR
jgi:cytochrome b